MSSCIFKFTEAGKAKVEALIQEWEDDNDSKLDYKETSDSLLDCLRDKQTLYGEPIVWNDIHFKMGVDIKLQKGLYNVKTI